MIGILYFIVILFANSLGAVSGMGGGVIIKPVFDWLDFHDVSTISFYSSVAVFTMSIVFIYKQRTYGISLKFQAIFWLALGAVIGGIGGNIVFERLLLLFHSPSLTQMVQIILTCMSLIFALVYTYYSSFSFRYRNSYTYGLCGLFLGFLSSLLGIGGGPINVAFIVLLFSIPLKQATVYSLCIIFFSQFSKLLSIAFTTGVDKYDVTMLCYIIPAAILGGMLGAWMSHRFSVKGVTRMFRIVVWAVLLLNIYNGLHIFLNL